MELPPRDRLLAGLTPEQRAAVTDESGLLCVLAGAGSGKTTVLTRRVAWRLHMASADADHVLVLTFTRKAASELRARLAHLGAPGGIRAGTFHSAAYGLLRRYWADRDIRPPSLLGDPTRLLREAGAELGIPAEAIATVAIEVAWARARLVDAARYPAAAASAGRQTPMPADQIAAVMTRFGDAKRRKRVIDLDDLVSLAGDVLEREAAFAAAERWRVRHLFVDEFQDVNPAQFRLLEQWRHGRGDLCAVGDPRQAIYAWNGSDPDLLVRLPVLIPGMTVVRLDQNHRSAPAIVSAALAVLGAAAGPHAVDEPGFRLEEGLPVEGGTGPVAVREVAGAPPSLTGFDDEEAEAAAVVRWLRGAHRPGRPWRHLAVLARTHARLEAVADALRRSGIPFRRAGDAAAGPVGEVLRELRRAPRNLPLHAALVDASAAGVELQGDVLRLVDEYAAEEEHRTVGGFLAWMSANPGAIDGNGASEDAVELATFHRAKGLEWPCVAVIGLEDGTAPIAYAVSDAAKAEERRLLYVALTRAEDELFCSWAAADATGRSRRRRPSPFLHPLRNAIAAGAPAPAAAAPARIAQLRAQLELSAAP
ncbi:MAG TPA: ATP-dependent helicase [Acidimicrobiales bacterium]|nr:ATP-dependent helicase [Acidimicrobiales bacterium]